MEASRRAGMVNSAQYARAWAAIVVVLFHASVGATAAFGGHIDWWFRAGVAGVDVFFVLSGFIMYISLRAGAEPPGAWDFFRRRLVRIVPLYWIATVCLASLYFGRLLEVFHQAPFYYFSSFLFIPQEVPGHPGEIYPLLSVGWTLNFEMFFYLLICLALMASGRAFAKPLLAGLLALVAFGLLTAPTGPVLRIWTSPLILEFAAGVTIGMAFRKGVRIAPVVAAMGAGLAVLVILSQTTSALLDHGTRLLVWGLPATILVGGMTLIRGGDWDNRWMLLLGSASYAIYLFHPIVITILRMGSIRWFGQQESGAGAIGFLVLALLLGTLGGVLAHLFLERPIAILLRRGAPRPM